MEAQMRESFLSFSPPLIGEEEIEEVVDTLRSDWLTTGPKTRRFEREFAQFVGAEAALAVSSCTHAMLVALAALGIVPGDEVITTTMTFCSTVHVIEQLGARPVLVDVEPDTLNIDPQQIKGAVTARTRALMPVHLYGHPCEMDAILDIAQQHSLQVVEDAAHALPATYKGQMVGTLGTLTAFSFYATKNLTTGEGGMLTGAGELIEQARPWSLHGMTRDAYMRYTAQGSWYYEVTLPGFKCNMSDIQAALGLQQLRKLHKFQQRRREIVQRYNRALAEFEELEPPVERPGVVSAWQLYALRLRPGTMTIDRNRFLEELRVRNIGSSVHFIPVHIHPYYAQEYAYKPEHFPVAYSNYLRLVTLPLNLRMSDSDVEDVLDAVSDVVTKHRR
jgi:dTDP-4-amino-4,6-dideoxygalactose transaminase